MHRTLTALTLGLIAGSASLADSRHDPVRIVTPERGQRVLISSVPDRSGVQTFTRSTTARTSAQIAEARSSLILVRTREPLPPIAITADQTIDDRTRDELRRAFPFVRRSDSVLDDLRRAQRTHLRETGAILRVRTFGPVRTTARADNKSVSRPAPIIRKAPARVLPADG